MGLTESSRVPREKAADRRRVDPGQVEGAGRSTGRAWGVAGLAHLREEVHLGQECVERGGSG